MRYEKLLPFYFFLWRFWREKRYRLFKRIMAPVPISSLLDVGGGAGDWFGRGDVVEQVDSLNIGEPAEVNPPPGSPRIRALKGDGTALAFADGSYEVVYSNSVIEHVGDWEAQKAFAREVMRVGRRLWIQTPAYGCPVEPHVLGIGIHWLPVSWRGFAARWFTVVGLTNAAGRDGLHAILRDTRMLRKREFRELFPGCEIHTERLFLIFPKSYVAIRRDDRAIDGPS